MVTQECVKLLPGLHLVDEIALVAIAQEADKAELAKQLSNPIASLINVPFQLNYDSNLGLADDGDQFKLNIQPVIPISLNEKWNLISRTIIPVLYVQDTFPGQGSEFGLGDITPAFWFSPKAPTKGGLIWGVGPQFLLPTATEDVLGAAMDAASRCDFCFSIGTTSLVQPAASLPLLALEHGAPVVEINPDETPLTPHADQAIRSGASEALVTLVSQLRAARRDNE